MKITKEGVWETIQGEGILAGTPSVFVRLFGCDFDCSWCDSKASWQPQFEKDTHNVSPDVVADLMRAHGADHAVITGGNPVLQIGDVAELAAMLREPSWSDDKSFFRAGMHVTVETQASVYDESLIYHVDLLSLSPKLHAWNDEPLRKYLDDVIRWPQHREAQVKVVVQSGEQAETVCGLVETLPLHPRIHYIVQPEFSIDRRKLLNDIYAVLSSWRKERRAGCTYPRVRVIPQLHKLVYFVP